MICITVNVHLDELGNPSEDKNLVINRKPHGRTDKGLDDKGSLGMLVVPFVKPLAVCRL